MIDIKNLNKQYMHASNSIKALDDINLYISEGDICGIIGLSGAGKSSLVRCINMIEKPTSGEIIINGEDITKLDEKALRNMRKKISMIFQGFNLLSSKTVFENVAFPLRLEKMPKDLINLRVSELLEWVELGDKANSYPAQLSGGQKQRVGIARALANKPDILLSDEATSALDPKTTNQILELLKRINKEMNITIVVITHEMNVVKSICDKTVILENGKIVAKGKTVDIFSNQNHGERPYLFNENNIEGLKNLQGKVLRLHFFGENATKPVISNLVRKYNVDVNIISGNIEYIQEKAFGNLNVELSNYDNMTSILEYLRSNQVKVEVIENDKYN